MDVSIILVSFNTKELTKQTISSVKKETQNLEYEIIVVDNASKDGSPEMIEECFPDVTLIKNPDNNGFGAANNLGIQAAQGKNILFLNPDTILCNNAITILHNFLEDPKNADIAICGPNLYNEDMTHQHSYGNFPTIKRLLFTLTGLNVFLPPLYKKIFNPYGLNESNELKEVDYVTGAALMIRKSVIDNLGAFDEDFFMYFEEAELCHRIKKNGYKTFINPDANIIHLESKSIKFPIHKFKMFRESELTYFEKLHGKSIRPIIKLLNIIRFSMALKPEEIKVILSLR